MYYKNIKRGEVAPRLISIKIRDHVRRLTLRRKFFSKKINSNDDFELKMYYDPVDKKTRSLKQIFGHTAKNGLIRRIHVLYYAFGIIAFGKPLPKTITVEVDGKKTIFFRRVVVSKDPVEQDLDIDKLYYQTATSVFLFTIKEILSFKKDKANTHRVMANYE